jgi:hypothetical protein
MTGEHALASLARELASRLPEAVGTGAGVAAMGASVHETGLAAVGTAGAVVAAQLVETSRALIRRRQGQVLDSAAAKIPLTVEQMLGEIAADDRLILLFGDVMRTAQRAADEVDAQALGRALADGVIRDDDAELDRAEWVIRTLGDVQPVHLRVLEHMSHPVPQWEESSFPDRRFRYSVNGLRAELPSVGQLMDSVIAVLSRNGLVVQAGTGSGLTPSFSPDVWEITETGRFLLAYRADAAAA